MDKSLFKFDDFFKTACVFEASLILVAVLLGWIADINPFQPLYFSEPAIAYGIAGTIPLFLMFLALEKLEGDSIVAIRNMLLKDPGPRFTSLSLDRFTDIGVDCRYFRRNPVSRRYSALDGIVMGNSGRLNRQ